MPPYRSPIAAGTSRDALHLRRRARGFEMQVERASRTNEPWTDKNVRMWQGYMSRDWKSRSAILLDYLSRRALRA